MTHIYVREQDQRWSKQSPVACKAPIHYLNQSLYVVIAPEKTMKLKLEYNDFYILTMASAKWSPICFSLYVFIH